jgi:methyltransferase (TIGR00027 family)
MRRTDGDTWDLATSVGATATMVAAARAVAAQRPNSVVRDCFAGPLVHASGVEFFSRLAAGQLDFGSVGGEVKTGWMPEVFAVRAKFFDEFFAGAGSRGIHQIVIVAAGLDARSYRLAWPAATTIYEIDQPEVIEFKRRTLAASGAVPTAELRSVGVDLRTDWPTALQQAGFDRRQPTAWIAEGLLIGYLPNDAQGRLIDDVTALSARGSELAVDHLPGAAEPLGPKMAQITEQWKAHGFDSDIGDLTYGGYEHDVDASLAALGWDVRRHSLFDLFVAAGIMDPGPELTTGLTEEIQYVTGVRV